MRTILFRIGPVFPKRFGFLPPPPIYTWLFNAWRARQGRGPFESVDDLVLQIRPAGPADVKRHGLEIPRPMDGRPEVVNDHIFNQPMY